MKNNVRHVLGISGGKDSAALAIYLNNKYPQFPVEYYFCDTGKELDDTYRLIERIESHLGKKITFLKAAEASHEENPFDHFLKLYGGFLPSSQARWCTKKLKLEPFENQFIKDDLALSFVGIRGDEDREGYISSKTNIQSIFPFRKNIWSEELLRMVLNNSLIPRIEQLTSEFVSAKKLDNYISTIQREVSPSYPLKRKLNDLLTIGTKEFNKIVYEFAKPLDIPISYVEDFPLLENEEVLVRDDIFALLERSAVGVPEYYKKIEFNSEGNKGYYSRSRSGCFFCFFQQKIEWVWLYETKRELFEKAMEYEKDGFSWMQDERLIDLIKPERIKQIKKEYIKKTERNAQNHKSEFLIDILQEAEGEGCAACFI